MSSEPVLVVGAGISGIAAARALTDRGVPVRVVERGRVPGGRMASRAWGGRRIDLGATYFTAEPGSEFAGVVAGLLERGTAREWSDRFAVAGPDGISGETSGPMRYAAPLGLRSIVADLAAGLPVEYETPVSAISAISASSSAPGDGGASASGSPVQTDARLTILAMPGPQARRLLPASSAALDQLDSADDWEPTIAVAFRFDERVWPADLHGAFVNGSDAITFVADDGDRRGDGAPVLVVHSSAELARAHLDDVSAAVPAIADATARALGLPTLEPVDSYAHRWTFARPARTHDEPFLLDRAAGFGVCGDGWGGRTSVGAAWASGHALGTALS